MQPSIMKSKTTSRPLSSVEARIHYNSLATSMSGSATNEIESTFIEDPSSISDLDSTERFALSFEDRWRNWTRSLFDRRLNYNVLPESIAATSKLASSWQLTALRGVFACLFGLLVLFLPEIPLAALVLAFACYTLLEGIVRTVVGLRDHPLSKWRWEMGLNGSMGFCVGLSSVVWPKALVLLFLYLMVGWAAAMGTLKVAEAIRNCPRIEGRAFYILEGVLSIAFGALVATLPMSGGMAITGLTGTYGFLFGLMLLTLAFRLYVIHTEFNAKTT